MPDLTGTAARSSLREATLSGLRWVGFARVVAEAVAFGSMIVLAHLIAPAEFGRVAIALIIQALGLVLVGDGVGIALVQRKTVERAHLECAALIGLLLGAVCAAVAFVLAPGLGSIVGEESVTLVRMLAPVFLISSIAIVPSAILQRRLDLRRTSLVEVGGIMARALASVAFAVAGLDGEAIVAGVLVGATTTTALYLVSAPSALPRWHAGPMREIARFGLPAAFAGVMLHGFRNVDYAIVGAKLGAAQLGFYWRGYQLGVEYQRKVTGVVSRVALPVFSRAADLDDMRAIRARVMRLQATIVLPPLALLVATAPTLVPWMLGEAWRPAVLPTQLLAGVGMMVAMQAGVGPLLLAAGRPGAVLAYNTGSAVVYGAAVLVSAPHGLTAVCLAALAFHALQLAFVQRVLFSRLMGITLRQVAADVGPAVVASVALVLVAVGASAALAAVGASPPFQLVGAALPAVAAYLLIVRRMFPAAWADLSLLLSRLVPRRRGPDPSVTIAGRRASAPVLSRQ